jgi:G3E family GTPase
MNKIPVHIISGFLGAGKTTEIIRLLRLKPADESWAIIINEFGKISIDGQTLQSESSRGSVYEISGGCICCTAKIYFRENLEKIIATSNFNRIIIEPSGLGGIDHITDMVLQHTGLQMMTVVCLVDITLTENPRLKKLPLYREQILKADLILFSKSELLNESELQDKVAIFQRDFPGKKYVLKTDGEFTLPNSHFDASTNDKLMFANIFAVHQEEKDPYLEFTMEITDNKPVNIQKLCELLANEKTILRAKGYIYTGEDWVLFNYTLSGISTEKCSQRKDNELVIIYNSSKTNDNQVFKFQIEDFFKS